MLGALLLAGVVLAPAADSALSIKPCEWPGVNGKARCGTFRVFEDREAKQGRTLELGFVILDATAPTHAPDAFVFINGGPGGASTNAAAGLAMMMGEVREKRDMLFLDLRGTGLSGALKCPLYGDPLDLDKVLGDYFPVAAVQECRKALEARADLTKYTTEASVDDLDDLRAALGYSQLDLYGGSYGSRVALVYMRRHPQHVRAAVLHGVVPTQVPLPLRFARDAQAALDGVLGECAAEGSCNAAFPALRAELAQVLATVQKAPVTATVMHPVTGTVATVSLGYDLTAEALRQMLYEPSSSSTIPLVVHEAAAGRWTRLAEAAIAARRSLIGGDVAQGLYLSVTCAEDLPFIETGAGEAAARGTFLGDYRLQQQRRACSFWPRGQASASFREPVQSNLPVLTFSGQWDPVTPPSQAAEALRTLPHGVAAVVPSGGHVFMGLTNADCGEHLIASFVAAGSADRLDMGCLATMHRPPFPTSLPDLTPVVLSEAALQRLAGHYADPKSGFAAEVALANGALQVSIPQQPPVRLVPVGGNRLRCVDDPAMTVRFDEEAGAVTGLSIELGGAVVMALPRAN